MDDVGAFRARFTLAAWFDGWRRALLHTPAATTASDYWPSSLRRLVLEALSDASAEQFLNPLVAAHLRYFGGQLAAEVAPQRSFWVRTEWEKVDLSYGLAKPFDVRQRDAWYKAWRSGETGDLGQCEVKVCYTHLHKGKIKSLAGQLEDRRDRDRHAGAHGLGHLRYHGLLWLFQHDGIDELRRVGTALEHEVQQLGLTVCHGFEYPDAPDDLGRLWPFIDGQTHRCGLSLALVELPPG